MFDFEKLEKVFEDKAFAEKYAKIETVKDAVAALVEKGIDVTEEEYEAALNFFKSVNEKGGELSDDELLGIAGGANLSDLILNKHLLFNDVPIFPQPLLPEITTTKFKFK